jgi:hypothetical protein
VIASSTVACRSTVMPPYTSDVVAWRVWRSLTLTSCSPAPATRIKGTGDLTKFSHRRRTSVEPSSARFESMMTQFRLSLPTPPSAGRMLVRTWTMHTSNGDISGHCSRPDNLTKTTMDIAKFHLRGRR